jgi:rhamnosyltransferase
MGFSPASEDAVTAPKIVAVVTAYCDADALRETLRAIVAQSPLSVSQILIVDNSPNPLPVPSLPQIRSDYVHMPHNPGLVASVNFAIEWAEHQHADFIWLFDQDSLPQTDCLYALWEGFQRMQQLGLQPAVVGPQIRERGTGRIHHGYEFLGYRYRMINNPQAPDGFYTCEMILHSGSLLRLNLDGGRLKRLPEWIFLDALEHALAEQVLSRGHSIGVITDAHMAHRYGKPVQIEHKRAVLLLQDYAPIRYYTICRNQTWFELRHAKGLINKVCAILYAFKRCRKMIRNIRLLNTDQQAWKIHLCRKGTIAGILGNKVLPHKLH